MNDNVPERQHVFLDGYAPDGVLHSGKNYKYKSYAKGSNQKPIIIKDESKKKLLVKLQAHYKNYKNIRELIEKDIKEIYNNKLVDIFDTYEFRELINAYEPYKNLVEYYIKKYENV